MASFASSVTTGGARKNAWTKTMASFASSATTGGARKNAWTNTKKLVMFPNPLYYLQRSCQGRARYKKEKSR